MSASHVPATATRERPAARPVSQPQDHSEREADRAADVVARGGSVTGWSFSSVAASAPGPIQRQEAGKGKSEDEKYKEAAKKAGEAALETDAGKALKERVLADPVVKTVTSPYVLVPAIAGGVAGLAATGKELPIQPPEIPLDRITPGLSGKVTYEGPVNAPTFVGLTITYKEQGPKGRKSSDKDKIAADVARLRAQQQMFKPQSEKAAEKKAEAEMVSAWITSGAGLTIPLTPQPRKDDSKKSEEQAPVQPAPASAGATMPTHASVDAALTTPGRPLDPATRRSMEARFGYDFSRVRIHDDARAAATARAIDAAAFTVGEDIVIGRGRTSAPSPEGDRLLAHELAHVIQQGGRRPGPAVVQRLPAGELVSRMADERALEGRTAPPIVHEVLRSPGHALDDSTQAAMESRLGADLGAVRLHTDERAARAAEAVGAAAYTVGRDVVFGRGFYRPTTSSGSDLLAHELAHVTQDHIVALPSKVIIGSPSHPAERDASTAASRSRSSVPEHASRAGIGLDAARGGGTSVLRRTVLGSLLGAAGGALGGALLGGLAGGPIGAVVGGLAGLFVGALIGETATTRSRSLTQPEIDYAREVYVDSVDYSSITITRDSVLALGAPRTIGNTIHLKSDWGHFKDDTLELTESGLLTLIHEMGHVWQYQNGGLAYIPESLLAQLRAAISGGARGGAYDWRAAHRANIPWEEWNPEQQAEAIQDYNQLLRRSKQGIASPAEMHELSVLLPYIEKVRRREGAPTYGRPDYESLFRHEDRWPGS